MNSSTASTSGEAHLLNFSVAKHGDTAWSMIQGRNLFTESEVLEGVSCAPTASISQGISAQKIVVTSLNLNSFFLIFKKKCTIKFYHTLAAFELCRTLCFCCDTCVRFRKFHIQSYLSSMRQVFGRQPSAAVLVSDFQWKGFPHLWLPE